MRAATATASSLLVLALLLLSLATPAAAQVEIPVSVLYRIRVDTKGLNLTSHTYGFIVPLGGNLFTAFVIEGGKYRCAHEDDRKYMFFVVPAAELLSISLAGRVYTCHEVEGAVLVGNRPEKNVAYVVRIREATVMRHTTDTVEISVFEELHFSQETAKSGGGILGAIFEAFKTAINFIMSLGDGLRLIGQTIVDSMKVLMAAIGYAGGVFGTLLEGFRALGPWIGNPGEPEALYYYNLYKTELSILSMAYYAQGTVVEDVLECKRPIRDALHLMGAGPSRYVNLTLCELEKRQPSGVFGALQVAFIALVNLGMLSQFIVQNFILLNVSVVVIFFLEGVYGSIRRRSLGPIERAVKRIVKIYEFYGRILKFIIETVWRIIDTITGFISSVLPF